MHADVEVDARGLTCPLPILRAKKALSAMATGQVLRITATDPGAADDFRTFATTTGHTLLDLTNAGGEFVIVLRKSETR
jgi:tRNA 2-thiouridine synthesizing protein A